MSKFSNRLKELRKTNCLTQRELGEIIGLSETGLQSYELEYSTPNIDKLEQLADYFKVSIDYLLGRTDDPKGSKYK